MDGQMDSGRFILGGIPLRKDIVHGINDDVRAGLATEKQSGDLGTGEIQGDGKSRVLYLEKAPKTESN